MLIPDYLKSKPYGGWSIVVPIEPLGICEQHVSRRSSLRFLYVSECSVYSPSLFAHGFICALWAYMCHYQRILAYMSDLVWYFADVWGLSTVSVKCYFP
jgi:hypothetical protein